MNRMLENINGRKYFEKTLGNIEYDPKRAILK